MNELDQAKSLANTICLAYYLADSKRPDNARECAARLLESASQVNKQHLLDITNMNNKEIHITIDYLTNRNNTIL